jgi:mycothiol synthase
MRVALPLPAPDDLEVPADLALPVGIELPDDIRLRNFEPGRDDTAWLALNNAAFAGHAEQGEWDAPILRARLREPWFDASWFLLAERDGELVGFNWLRRHPAGRSDPETGRSDPEMGEIYVIGVAPSAQGHGLGRALTIAGLERIAAAGLTTAVLYVAGENTAAIALYRALGFALTRTDRAYTALVVPADS